MKIAFTKKRILKILFLSTVLIIAWGVIWASFITKTVRKNNSDGNMKNQHEILKNIIVTETREEKKYWEFYAKTGEYISEDNQVQLNDVIGNFYDKDGLVVVSFKSSKGNYDEKSKKVTLNGDNLFVGKDGSQLFADELIWQGEDKDILAFGNVQFIHSDKLVTKAQKAVLNSALTSFKVMGKTKTSLYGTSEDKKKYTRL